MILLCVLSSQARPELGPPSIKLKSTISNIALMKLLAITDNHLEFQLIENIHNQAPPEVSLLVNQDLAESVMVGRTYVVGYIAWQTDRFTKQVSARVGGPVLMNLPGAEPAIFTESPELIDLLKIAVDESLKSNQKISDLIVSGLNNYDPQLQNFFVVELITRKSLHQTPAMRDRIQALFLDPQLAWHLKRFILVNGGLTEQQLASDWYCQFAANTLNYASTQLDPKGSDSGLIIQLIEKNNSCQSTKYSIDFSRWITSNNSGVVEAAIGKMRAGDLEQTILAVENGLKSGVLKRKNRQTLSNYLIRLINERNAVQSNQ